MDKIKYEGLDEKNGPDREREINCIFVLNESKFVHEKCNFLQTKKRSSQ